MLPSPAYGSRPELLATHSLQDSFIPYSKPVLTDTFRGSCRAENALARQEPRRLALPSTDNRELF